MLSVLWHGFESCYIFFFVSFSIMIFAGRLVSIRLLNQFRKINLIIYVFICIFICFEDQTRNSTFFSRKSFHCCCLRFANTCWHSCRYELLFGFNSATRCVYVHQILQVKTCKNLDYSPYRQIFISYHFSSFYWFVHIASIVSIVLCLRLTNKKQMQ